jgi:PIN domain nuclease of toxin-antitoxin system
MYLDTHALVWLYAGEVNRFPQRAQKLLEDEPLLVSPMAVLELQYLYETERITVPPSQIIEYLESAIELEVCRLSFHRVVMESCDLKWTRDPFDRLIVAQAIAGGQILLTKDKTIHAQTELAVWE